MAKVKMKTKRSAAKRYKLTASGKLLRRRAYKSHILTKKTRKRKRRLGKVIEVRDEDRKRTVLQLPYPKYLR